MRLIARELGMIAIVLSVGAFCVGAAARPLNSKSAHFNGTGTITKQLPSGWISSSSYNLDDGTIIVNFAPGLFSAPPNCTIRTDDSPNKSSSIYWNTFPQPISAFSDGVVIMDSIDPKRHAHPLRPFGLVCVGS
jgi:hypothetical protein